MRDAIQKIRARDLGLLERTADGVVAQTQQLDFGVVGVEALWVAKRAGQRCAYVRATKKEMA